MRGPPQRGSSGRGVPVPRERPAAASASARPEAPPPPPSSSTGRYLEISKPTSRNPFARASQPAEDRKPPPPSSSSHHEGLRGSNGSTLPPQPPTTTSTSASASNVASLSSRHADWDQAPTNKTWYTLGELREIRDLMQRPERPHDLASLIIAVEKKPHMRALSERKGSEDLTATKSTGKASPFAYKERVGEDREASRQGGRDGGLRKWSGDYTRKESPFQSREREREHGDRDDYLRDGGGRRRGQENFGRPNRESPFGSRGREREGLDQQPDWDVRPSGRKGSEDFGGGPFSGNRDRERAGAGAGGGPRRRKEGLWDTPSSAFDGVDFDFTQGDDAVAAMEAERARFLGVQVRNLDDSKPETPVHDHPTPATMTAPTPADVVDVSALESKMVQVMSLSALEDSLGTQGPAKPQPQRPPAPVAPSPEPQKLPSSINELQIDIDQLLFPLVGAPLGGVVADAGTGAGEPPGFADFDMGKGGGSGDPFRTGLFSFAAPGAAISTIDLYRELNHGTLFGDLQGGGFRKPDDATSSSSRLQGWSSQGGDSGMGAELRGGNKHDDGLLLSSSPQVPPPPPPHTLELLVPSTVMARGPPPNENALLKNMLGIGQMMNPPRGPPPAPTPPPPPPTSEQASNNLLEILGFAKKNPTQDPPPQVPGVAATPPKQSPFAFHEKKAPPTTTRKANGVRPAAPRPLVHHAVPGKAQAGLIPVNVLARKQVASPPVAPGNLPEQQQPRVARPSPLHPPQPQPQPQQPMAPSANGNGRVAQAGQVPPAPPLNPALQALFAKVSGPPGGGAPPSSSTSAATISLADIEKQVRK